MKKKKAEEIENECAVPIGRKDVIMNKKFIPIENLIKRAQKQGGIIEMDLIGFWSLAQEILDYVDKKNKRVRSLKETEKIKLVNSIPCDYPKCNRKAIYKVTGEGRYYCKRHKGDLKEDNKILYPINKLTIRN